MEGYRYVPCSQQRGIAPAVDFEATPPAQLGITPRAVQALFDHIAADTGRRYAVQCSFIQLYREQAHDLLSPLAYPAERPEERRTAAGGSLSRRGEGAEGGGPLLGAGLKLRWSKAEEFYLEGELRVTASSPQQAVALYRHGVANKVMASHALNASSR